MKIADAVNGAETLHHWGGAKVHHRRLGFDDALLFTPTFHVPPLGLHCRLDRHRLDGAEKLSGDRCVDTKGVSAVQPIFDAIEPIAVHSEA